MARPIRLPAARQTDVTDEDDEEISDADVIYEVTTYGADFDVEGLVKRFDRGDIYIPSFQRNFVWTQKQASRLVESILLGLPIPSVFLYREEETNKLLIVDGLQRLTTLQAFVKGHLPGSDKIFRLTEVRKDYLGKTIEDLLPSDRRRFADTIIHANIIRQSSPDDDYSAVYHIFDRLNSNGTPAQPQEIRAAIFHGRFQERLDNMNQDEYWRRIFGPEHKRSKDVELILRFLALEEDFEYYAKPMEKFLNTYMSEHRNPKERWLDTKESIFNQTCQRVVDALGYRPFRPRGSLNAAIFDAFMVGVAKVPEASHRRISRVYERLMVDEEFSQYVQKATSDESNVVGRIESVIRALNVG